MSLRTRSRQLLRDADVLTWVSAPGVPDVVGPHDGVGPGLTAGLALQHLAAMFASSILVPALTGLPITTTLLFCGIGSIIFVVFTRNRVPGYLGASFAFLAPLLAAKPFGVAAQLGGVLGTGLLLAAIGVVVKSLGVRLIESAIPPAVAGALVLLVSAGVVRPAVMLVGDQPVVAAATLLTMLVLMFVVRGVLRRLGMLIGIVVGWIVAASTGVLSSERWASIGHAAWIGVPEMHAPQLNPDVVLMMVPAVLVLVAEYIAHVKAVASVTGQNLDDVAGDSMVAGGFATILGGFGGGVPVTSSVANLAVLAASRVYTTTPCVVGGLAAIALAFCPKFAALVSTVPTGVLAGAAVVVVGMTSGIGVRILRRNGIPLWDPATIVLLVIAVVAGLGGFSVAGLDGMAWGALLIVFGYPLLHRLPGRRPAVTPAP